MNLENRRAQRPATVPSVYGPLICSLLATMTMNWQILLLLVVDLLLVYPEEYPPWPFIKVPVLGSEYCLLDHCRVSWRGARLYFQVQASK